MVHSPIGNSSAKANRSSHWFCGTFCFLCAASFVIVTFLFLSIIFVVLDIPLGIQPITLGSLILKIYHKLLLPLVGYFASILRVMFPWPALVLFILAIVIWGPDRISRILSNIGTIELPGWIKFEGKAPSKEFQKELGEAARFVERANREIGEAYEGAKRFASDLRERTDIPRLVSNAAKQVAQKVGERCPEDYRLTLYVADFVFSDRLYQFTEYYNSQGDAISSGKAGRTFSIRYGIIGRVWRSGVHEIEGNLISTQEQTHVDDDNIERFIARRWGLTLREAIHVRQYNSYGALRLERADQPVGVLYFDSKTRGAFGDAKLLEEAILSLSDVDALAVKLLEISHEVAPWSGRIQIYRTPR